MSLPAKAALKLHKSLKDGDYSCVMNSLFIRYAIVAYLADSAIVEFIENGPCSKFSECCNRWSKNHEKMLLRNLHGTSYVPKDSSSATRLLRIFNDMLGLVTERLSPIHDTCLSSALTEKYVREALGDPAVWQNKIRQNIILARELIPLWSNGGKICKNGELRWSKKGELSDIFVRPP